MPLRLAGIQPGYLPWLGYFDQMRRVDVFVIADEMQFSTSGWAHRNRVRGPEGAHWLTLPARPRRGQPICDVPLDPSVPWRTKHLETLRQFYARSPFSTDLLDAIARIFENPASRLVDITLPLLRWLTERFGIHTPWVISSEAKLEKAYAEQFPDRPSPTHRIIAFMKTLGANELLEGESGRTYLDVALCEAHGIQVNFQQYAHPTYAQLFSPFVSHLSALDLLLACGENEARHVFESAP